jgi:Signal transduction histidine kinase
MPDPIKREQTATSQSRIQIPLFYKLMISMLFVATIPIVLLGIVSIGGTSSIVTTIGSENSIIIITVINVSVVLMWSYFLSRRITDPVVHLSRIATRLSRGEMTDTEIVIQSNDEIGELATAFSKMINTYKILDTLAREEVER